jgi:cation transport regulator ChaB
MPKGRTEIPSTIERSDKHAQKIWKETHDSAVEEYGEGEHAHRVAFASLKHSYKKEGDHWVAKSRKGPSDAQAARGPDTKIKSTDPNTAKTAGGKVDTGGKTKDELMAEARKLDIEGRSKMDKDALAVAIREAKR